MRGNAKQVMRRRVAGTSPEHELRTRALPDGLPAAVPLVHVTAVHTAKEIVKGGKLETRKCNTLKKDLLYFFALKPAYGLKEGEDKTHQLTRFPFAFVVDAKAVPEPYHVYPFDTGGALGGLFTAADPLVPLEDYELRPAHAGVMGHIGWAFGSIEAYFDGELRSDILTGVPRYAGVTRGFIDIARSPAKDSNRPDGRAAAIEVASSHNVSLKNNVLLAVIPRQFLEGDAGDDPNEDFIAKLEAECIPYETYDWEPNSSPNAYRDEITTIVKAFYDAYRKG